MGRYLAPAVAAGVFCGSIADGAYSDTFAQMSASTHSQITSTQFADAFVALDAVEGKASKCAAASGSNSYSASPFGDTATAMLVITRATAGTLQGSVHLKKESSGWRVDAIDSSLLGVNLSALVTADRYCTALKSQQYADAYALLGAKVQAAMKQADWVQLQQWHDTIDGQVSSCAVTAFAVATSGGSTSGSTGSTGSTSSATPAPTKSPAPTGTPTGTPAAGGTSGSNSAATPSDTSATITVSLARGKAAAQQGALTLAVEGDAWKIGEVATTLQGSDLSALQTGQHFCADLASGNYADAYTQVDAFFVGYRTQTQAVALFNGTSASSGGIAWSSCTLDASTYKVDTSTQRVGYNMTVTFTSKASGSTFQFTKLFVLVQVSGVWKLHGYVSA